MAEVNDMILKNDRMLTARQLAGLLNVHINTVRRWNNQGFIQAYRIGARGDRRFDMDEVTRFLVEKRKLHDTIALPPPVKPNSPQGA